MISSGLRRGLSMVALIVMVGGPLFAVLAFLTSAGAEEPRLGLTLGAALRLFFATLVAGGVLRVLVSIDARLEARN